MRKQKLLGFVRGYATTTSVSGVFSVLPPWTFMISCHNFMLLQRSMKRPSQFMREFYNRLLVMATFCLKDPICLILSFVNSSYSNSLDHDFHRINQFLLKTT